VTGGGVFTWYFFVSLISVQLMCYLWHIVAFKLAYWPKSILWENSALIWEQCMN